MTQPSPPDLRAVFEALSEAILVVDTAGRVLEANAAARRALRLDLAATPPDLTALCPGFAAAAAPSLLEHLADAARGEDQELDWSFVPLAGPPLRVAARLRHLDEERVVVSFLPVAAARAAVPGTSGAEILPDDVDAFLGRFQNVAAELMERERTMSWGLRAVIDAADELVRCEDLDTVCRRGVELARERLGLERCALFLLAADRQHVLGTYGTDLEGHTTDEHQGRIAVADHPELVHPPSGLWTVIDTTDHTFWSSDEHRVVGQGWVACTLIRSVTGPIGVFYNDSARSGAPFNEALQETVAVYCSLLGNVIERRRSEERQHAMARALNGILEATDELIGHGERDTFFRRAVELAREKLHVERCAIFLLDPERQELTGTYGTDAQGRTTDERQARWPMSQRPELFAGSERWFYSDSPLTFWRGSQTEVVGAGWCALTFIRMDSEPIGVFSNDNALSQAPADDVTQEAIALYCSMLGHILRRMRAEAEREKLIGELEAKNAELERFTYSVSHDLKSPLITIRGFLGFLEQDAVSGNVERLRADIRRIADAASKMHRLLDELLELSRIGRIVNPPEEVSFAEVTREAVELLQGRIQQAGVMVTSAPDLPLVWGDRARLVEVVQNLVDNAAKFCGGQPAPRVEIGAQRLEGTTVLFVRDNGIGVEPRFHQTIFGLFNKLDAKSEGTGVGLALVKRIIEVHGGRIWVESQGDGRGATFYFTLAPRPAASPPTSTTAAGTAGIQ